MAWSQLTALCLTQRTALLGKRTDLAQSIELPSEVFTQLTSTLAKPGAPEAMSLRVPAILTFLPFVCSNGTGGWRRAAQGKWRGPVC